MQPYCSSPLRNPFAPSLVAFDMSLARLCQLCRWRGWIATCMKMCGEMLRCHSLACAVARRRSGKLTRGRREYRGESRGYRRLWRYRRRGGKELRKVMLLAAVMAMVLAAAAPAFAQASASASASASVSAGGANAVGGSVQYVDCDQIQAAATG